MRPTPPTAWLLLSQGRAVTWPSLQWAHGCGPRLSFLGPTLPVAIAPRDWPGPLAAAVPLGLLLGPATQVVPVVDVTEGPFRRPQAPGCSLGWVALRCVVALVL